ncbi:MAG: hypothetical protein M1457_04030, partial [bacterium]|nr:hypothetical protein [bacterium]
MITEPTILLLDAPPAAGCPEADVVAALGGVHPRVIDMRAFGAPPLDEALARADFILTASTDMTAAMIRRARRCLLITYYGPGAAPGAARVALAEARAAGIYVASVPATL